MMYLNGLESDRWFRDQPYQGRNPTTGFGKVNTKGLPLQQVDKNFRY